MGRKVIKKRDVVGVVAKHNIFGLIVPLVESGEDN